MFVSYSRFTLADTTQLVSGGVNWLLVVDRNVSVEAVHPV